MARLAGKREASVRNHVAYLRRRMEDLVGNAVAIAQERGGGYRLVLRAEAPAVDGGASAY